MIAKYWSKLASEIKQANAKYPWKDKIEKIFWRGATTGGATSRYSILLTLKLKYIIANIKGPST